MTVQVYDQAGNVVGERALHEKVFHSPASPHVLREAVRAYMTHQRAGTASTKTRGEVSRSNRKPWPQKHTGRARAGTFRSPLWVGGGIIFGPKPREFSFKLNKRVKRQALRGALSLRAASGDLVVVERLSLPEPKTKAMVQVLEALGLADKKTLLVMPSRDEVIVRAGRNIPTLDMTLCSSLTTYRILRAEKLLMTVDALAQVEARWAE